MQEIIELMQTLDFPEQAVKELSECLEQNKNDPRFLLALAMFKADADTLEKALELVERFAEETGQNPYRLDMCLLLAAAPTMRARYRAKGLPDSLFLNTIVDLRYKLMECFECKGVYGTFVASWYRGFYALERFGLGRLQFEERAFREDVYQKGSACVKKGERVIRLHIPSSGPLTREDRMDSYRRAYEFFGGKNGEPMAFICGSWLLYPPHRAALKPTSNIADFMNDFEILTVTESEQFHDAWRLFGADAAKPATELPTDTSLRRFYAERLIKGEPTGSAEGIFFFDGEKVL